MDATSGNTGRRTGRTERAATLVEYALLVVVIALPALLAMQFIGRAVGEPLDEAGVAVADSSVPPLEQQGGPGGGGGGGDIGGGGGSGNGGSGDGSGSGSGSGVDTSGILNPSTTSTSTTSTTSTTVPQVTAPSVSPTTTPPTPPAVPDGDDG